MTFFEELLNGDFMPHGHCLLWRPDLLILHVGGDIATVIAYFAIPIALISLVKARKDLEFDSVFIMFAAFIFLCGITHLISTINIWHGYYYIEGLAKTLTGIVSLATAGMVWKLLPAVRAIPSRHEVLVNNQALQDAEEDLLEANRLLEARVKQRTEELKKLTITDPLTGVKNRRGLIDKLDQELDRCLRYNHNLSILMVDLDNFKAINDTHGHHAGDAVLIAAAGTMEKLVRAVDTVGRYGGEEFVVLLPETSASGALNLAQRVCESLAAEAVSSTSEPIKFTCSIGVAEWDKSSSSADLLKRADQAMYQAKRLGKNRAVVAEAVAAN